MTLGLQRLTLEPPAVQKWWFRNKFQNSTAMSFDPHRYPIADSNTGIRGPCLFQLAPAGAGTANPALF
jgi:hypothetical protein